MMKYNTKKIVITIVANGFMLFCIWIFANYLMRNTYLSRDYRFYTDDTTFVKTIQTVKKKNPILIVDSSLFFHDNYIPEGSNRYYCFSYFRSTLYKDVIYKTRFATLKSRDTITTLELRGYFQKTNYPIIIFYRDIDEDESEPYFKDFETSILPLLEKELGMKAEIKD